MATVHFPQEPARYTSNMTVEFPVLIGGKRVQAEISADALKERFGARSDAGAELLRAFNASRKAIEHIARAKLPDRLATGRLLLDAADF